MLVLEGGKVLKKGTEAIDFIEEMRSEAHERLELGDAFYPDLFLLGSGGYSPLDGFMVEEQVEGVLDDMEVDGKPWTVPVVLPWSPGIRPGDAVLLTYKGTPVGVVEVEETFSMSRRKYAKKLYGTLSSLHPGVEFHDEWFMWSGRYYFFGGRTYLFYGQALKPGMLLLPADTRAAFEKLGWKTVAAFQARNVPHLGHEFAMRYALEHVDGLFVNPVVGWRKKGDYVPELVVRAFATLLVNYFPKGRYFLSPLYYSMRYAGPREAVHHAIIRRNFGATHFIVGRDHAGVGNFYDKYGAWELFETLDLGIEPIFVSEVVYCLKCGLVTRKTCPHGDAITISGTDIRKQIQRAIEEGWKEEFVYWLLRPEVSEEVAKHERVFV